MSKVLLSTDFSPNAERAAEYAIQLFGTDSTYLLLHMYEEPKGGAANAMKDFRGIMKSDALDALKKEKARLVQSSGISSSHVQILADYGSGGRELAHLAENFNQKVIVMGHIGQSGIQTAFLGSIAFQTIRNSQIPVLLVPDVDLPDPKGAVLATASEIPRFSVEMKRMNDLTRLPVSMLRVVHNESEISERFGKETIANYQRGEVTVKQVVARTPALGILKFMEEHPGYILSLIPRDRGFWQRLMGRTSLVQTMANRSKFPILTWSRRDFQADAD
jgi:nucleotide-binding universal stress UspA family protein